MSEQLNVRVPSSTSQQIKDLIDWTGMTQTQMVLQAIDRLHQSYKQERGQNMRSIGKASYIGSEGAAFERVRLAFRIYGFRPPRPDTISGGEANGAYVMNILNQYQDEQEAMAIVRYGLEHNRQSLQQEVEHPELTYSLEELIALYTGDEER